MVTTDLLWTVLGAALGGSGMVGMLFFLLRHYIEKRLNKAEREEVKHREARIRRNQIEDELDHAYGRLLFWQYRAIVTGQHNGELDKAFTDMQEAERRKKELDRAIIAENEIE